MNPLITGGTGFLGSYVVKDLLRDSEASPLLLVRATDIDEAKRKLWKALQLHMEFQEFMDHLPRITFLLGDITKDNFGFSSEEDKIVQDRCDSILHIAASLNRKSAKTCFNVNLRGTLHALLLAQKLQARGGFQRFSEVSTVAVCGKRQNEMVSEDKSIDWSRSDYDPYARTKKFCEYMLSHLMDKGKHLTFRPSIVMGDSEHAKTTQFDMVRAFSALAQMPVLPLKPENRVDIVPANFVGKAIATLHLKEAPEHTVYHLSAGSSSSTFQDIVQTLAEAGLRKAKFAPYLDAPFQFGFRALGWTPRPQSFRRLSALMQVFWPYVTFNTVFDSSRVCNELGMRPPSFLNYAAELFTFAKTHKYTYPYRDWPMTHAK